MNDKNVAASVHARLQNHARSTGQPFQQLLQYYAMAMQLDVGFGDVVTPDAETITYPTLLDFPAPQLCPEKLSEIVPLLVEFLLPVAQACATGAAFEQLWTAGGPWGTGS